MKKGELAPDGLAEINKKEKNHFVHNTICAANFNMSYKAAASKILEELN